MTRLADQLDMSGKVVVVTGGSRGIGRAVAQGFAEAGADVVIASRKLENCQSAATEIERSTGRRALPSDATSGGGTTPTCSWTPSTTRSGAATC